MSLSVTLKDSEPLEIEHNGEKIVIKVLGKRLAHRVIIDAPRSFVVKRGKKKEEDSCQPLGVQLDLGFNLK